jgi:ComF family protein
MTKPPWLQKLADGLLDLVFAPICVSCGGAIPSSDSVRVVCLLCWSRASPIPAPRCERCWHPLLVPDEECRACDSLIPGVRCVRSAFLMESTVREIVHALKYRGWESVSLPAAQRLARVPLPRDVHEEAGLVVPVPVSAVRMRERGYNQAALLARAFAGLTGRDCAPDLLRRTRATETQTALHPDERRANVAGAFEVADNEAGRIHRRHLLLIDDVWTTGATALACADTLLSAGARAVSILTLARAVPGLRLS